MTQHGQRKEENLLNWQFIIEGIKTAVSHTIHALKLYDEIWSDSIDCLHDERLRGTCDVY